MKVEGGDLRPRFWPLTPEMLACPAVVRLLRGLTFLWAGVNLAIGATTLTLLLWLPLAAYVALKQVVSLAITAQTQKTPRGLSGRSKLTPNCAHSASQAYAAGCWLYDVPMGLFQGHRH